MPSPADRQHDPRQPQIPLAVTRTELFLVAESLLQALVTLLETYEDEVFDNNRSRPLICDAVGLQISMAKAILHGEPRATPGV